MNTGNLIFSTVFIAGLVSFFAPCTYPLIPVYIGLMTDENEDFKSYKIGILTIKLGAILNSLAFVLGLSVAFIILGFGAGILGDIIHSSWVTLIGGGFIVLLGLEQMEILKLPKFFTIKSIRIKNRGVGLVKTFLTGLAFSLGWTPCVGPILGAVLLSAASTGQAFYGGLMMMVYALGLAIPFVILAIASGSLMTYFDKMEKHLIMIKKVGGVFIVIMGLVLMSNKLGSISTWFGRLIY